MDRKAFLATKPALRCPTGRPPYPRFGGRPPQLERWILARDEYGRRRVDDADDWVRHEIRLALEHGKTVMPLLAPESSSDDVIERAIRDETGSDRRGSHPVSSR